ncbi:trypsin-like peptidase domain-containing protein [Candidatus Microgenomates bacterium]|nr:trypsin-like peptidase domain-containing protein [Candidatus Microgenomates bacterium]
MKRIFLLFAILIILLAGGISSDLLGVSWTDVGGFLRMGRSEVEISPPFSQEKIRVVTEESMVIDVVEKVSPSVVTVGASKNQVVRDVFEFDPFDPFSIFETPQRQEKVEQNIGTGFVIAKEGLIVTNKHVVADRDADYKVLTKDDQDYQVIKIYRDPVNDLAILKIDPSAGGLEPIEFGDSSKLKVGQFVIAIGTALGEFKNTVTTGVISGLGRGITAGSPFEGFVEQLDDVIQTDAAISPGNSGGPILNSAGQVIGVNVAVSMQGENIGFAIPINVVKESLTNFNKTGKFSRPYLGVRYRIIGRDLALLNEVPQGAYLVEIMVDSPAEKAGLQEGDIITKINDKPIREEDGGIAEIINENKVGDKLSLEVWRDDKTFSLDVNLEEFEE